MTLPYRPGFPTVFIPGGDVYLQLELLPFEKTDKSKISDIDRRRKNQLPPVPLNTTSAVALLTRLMRITAKKALDLMAELYNKGYLSYPRTENRRFKANFPHKGILSGLLGFSDFIPLIKQIKNSNSVRVNGKKMGEEDHDPIHPTGVVTGISTIDKQLIRAWVILSKYYISLFMDDYILDTDVVIVRCGLTLWERQVSLYSGHAKGIHFQS